jgi:hypothetical protein
MLYNSNFDASDFKKREDNEFNRLSEDSCYIQSKDESNAKKLKFITTNHADLLDAKEKLNFFGMAIKDHLFVPSEQIDEDSSLRLGKTGGFSTQCKAKSDFGQLPLPTMPARYQLAHGDIKVEDELRINPTAPNKQSCNPRDTEYFKRSFYIFDDNKGIETPNALKSVETKDFGLRGGLNTRFIGSNSKSLK